eukprot:Gb_28669 [translate_table: standard]
MEEVDEVLGEQKQKMLRVEQVRALKVVGSGGMGTVFLAELTEDCERRLVAVKAISKEKSKHEGGMKKMEMERDILSTLTQHPIPFLPSLIAQLETHNMVGWLMEYCAGGNLDSLLRRTRNGGASFSDQDIRFYAAEIVVGLEHLHKHGIAYRDLKPDNILLRENGHIMLTDFDLSALLKPKQYTPPPVPATTDPDPVQGDDGEEEGQLCSLLGCCGPLFRHRCKKLSKPKRPTQRAHVSPSSTVSSSSRTTTASAPPVASDASVGEEGQFQLERSFSFVGTEEYVAPEIVSRSGHDFSVDWWSLGILLYEMKYGETPFLGETTNETLNNIGSKYTELRGEWSALLDLIHRLLQKDPTKRLGGGRNGAEDIKTHFFFNALSWEDVLNQSCTPPFLPAPLPFCNSLSETASIDMEENVTQNIYHRH